MEISALQNIANLLEQEAPEILRQWEAKVRVVLPAARSESRPVLRNSIPTFLKELAQTLSGREDSEPAESRARAPREHAEQRATLPAYSLEQVIQEYNLLRKVILDVLSASTKIELGELHVILDTIDVGIQEASAYYVKLQSQALQKSEERFRLLVAGVRDYAIFMLDPEGYIVSWNQGAELIKGYTADEIIGKHFSAFYTEDDIRRGKPARNLEKATRDGRLEEEGLRLRKDGSTFFASVLITALKDEKGKLRGFAKVTRDITERRAMETELRKHAEALDDLNRRKDEFLAMLAHELRNPLASIVTSAEILCLHHINDPEIKQAQSIIDRQGKHLARLVDDLLDVARVTQGKIELRKGPIELNKLVDQVADTLRPFIEERQQKFAISLWQTEIWVEADSTRLSQVLSNLIHNSAKFTGNGGHIDLRVCAERDEAIVQIRDTGSGIDSELLPRVFDIFIQGGPTYEGGISGLGVGLTLVKSLVEMHGGTVSAKSEGPGTGSEFVVRLPVLKIGKMEVDKSVPRSEENLQHPSKHILVVDDNIDAAESIAMLLRLLGHTVHVAYSGKEALNAAVSEKPQIVLLDIGLPDMTGYEVARKLKAHSLLKNIQLIALSGYGQEQDRHKSQEAGFNNHLTKPADLTMLQNIINPGNR